MEIKRDNPKRRKSFRARHKCSQAKDRTTPKYWSCRMWSSKPVSKIVGEDLKESIKNSIFDKNYFYLYYLNLLLGCFKFLTSLIK
jgi:hypothetical protein